MFCAGRGYHGRFLLFQKISSSTSYFNDLLQGCRAVVFISTFPVSVTVPTASVVVCGVSFGGMHPLARLVYSRK